MITDHRNNPFIFRWSLFAELLSCINFLYDGQQNEDRIKPHKP
jgi:hypothetical protein